MSTTLGKNYSFGTLLKFATPTIIMMLISALYSIVDGVFVARFVGADALSAVNIIMPLYSVFWSVAIMFATGGSAIIARKMGEGNDYEAKQDFTLIVLFATLIGVVVLVVGLVFLKQIVTALGATPSLYDYCYEYAFVLLLFSPIIIIKNMFEYLMVTAGKPKLGLALSMFGGAAHLILAYVFIEPMQMGIAGAALATGVGCLIPAFAGVAYFFHKKSLLYFVKPSWNWRVLLESCGNGSSEMVVNLSEGVTTLLFNLAMLKYVGESGVAAITIVLYAQWLLVSVYAGYSSGIAPIISYKYGSEDWPQLRKIVRASYVFIIISSVVVLAISYLGAKEMVMVFSDPGTEVYTLALRGMYLFAISFLFVGVNVFASSMFTAFSNGRVSALISFLRTFGFLILGILVLPLFMGVDGVWISIPFAEVATLAFSIFFTIRYAEEYGYCRSIEEEEKKEKSREKKDVALEHVKEKTSSCYL